MSVSSARHEGGHRRDALWIAAMVHRISGILLAVFLPLHFLALGLAIEGEARFGLFLKWTDQPLVKFAEAGLVALLVVHLLGGIRLLVMELVAWHGGQRTAAILALVAAAIAGLAFLVNVMI